MKEIHRANLSVQRMGRAIEDHVQGRISRKALLMYLKWQMAAADENSVMSFLAEAEDQMNLDAGLLSEVTRTYAENVQHWAFPEEPGLSSALPSAIECTFPELVHAVNRAAGELRYVSKMLTGVNVRLNLRGSYAAIGEALQLVRKDAALLEQACELVGTGAPLALAFPREESEDRPSWASPGGAPLSPKQIAWLASIAEEQPEFCIAYSDGISGHSAPPQLVTERIAARERQAIRKVENEKLEEQMQNAMAESCPRCHSAPGAPCRSRAGKETTMHVGRYTTRS